MDHKFTQQIKAWIDTPADKRNYETGALYMLKLSGNHILYQNAMRNLPRFKQIIEYQLQKYYNFRVLDLTHQQVEGMHTEVDRIAKEHDLTSKTPKEKGKRADHDSLPTEIQALYNKNHVIIRRMMELHLRLRTLSLADSPCPDSERYPFLKELISLDKELHSNWEKYDQFREPTKKAGNKK